MPGVSAGLVGNVCPEAGSADRFRPVGGKRTVRRSGLPSLSSKGLSTVARPRKF
jgi:hypothetical protein